MNLNRRKFLASLLAVALAPKLLLKETKFPRTLAEFDSNGHPRFYIDGSGDTYIDEPIYLRKTYSSTISIRRSDIESDIYKFPWKNAREIVRHHNQYIDNQIMRRYL